MVSINLEDLDEETAVRLRARAVGNGCSVEEEALNILRIALDKPGDAALSQEPRRSRSRAV